MPIYSKLKPVGYHVLGDRNRTDTEEVLAAEAAKKGENYQSVYKPQIK